MLRHLVRTVPFVLLVAAAWVSPLRAQVVPLKTVPIPSGEQFVLHPSANFGLAGISIPLDDPQADPFTNPARGALLRGLVVHAMPTFYGETNDAVGGQTLPVAATLGNGRQFGTLLVAVQELRDFRPRIWGVPPADAATSLFGDVGINTYVQGSLGLVTPDGRTSFGAAGLYADLGMLDGASQLYTRATSLDFEGHLAEIRVGAMREIGSDRRLDLVLVRRDLDMTHRQTLGQWVVTDSALWQREWQSWRETGYDRTLTHAAQLEFSGPAGEKSRFGLVLGGSWKSHPKIPEYDLNFPRDPGTSRAFSIGGGLSEQDGRARFAVEGVFEPAWSHTWGIADTTLTNPHGLEIVPGDRSVDNRFRFSNWSLAGALEYEVNRVDLQFGLRVRAIRYQLEQENFLTGVFRETREGWLEWSPSWGVVFRLDEFDVRYTGRWTSKGNPRGCGFLIFGACDDPVVAAPGDIDYVVAPEGPASMPDYRVTTHRFSVSVPIGRDPEPAAEPTVDD